MATNEPPRATLEHHHKASGDAFKSGFNLTLGCFAACGVVGALLIGGCIALSVVMAPEVERRQQQRKQEMEERLKKIDDAAEQIRRDYERSLRESQRQ